MQHVRGILIFGCFWAVIGQWLVLMSIFLQWMTMVNKGFSSYEVSLGRSALFVFFVASAGLISLCFIARRGLPAGSIERGAVPAVMGALAAGAALLVLGLCTPYIASADR